MVRPQDTYLAFVRIAPQLVSLQDAQLKGCRDSAPNCETTRHIPHMS